MRQTDIILKITVLDTENFKSYIANIDFSVDNLGYSTFGHI